MKNKIRIILLILIATILLEFVFFRLWVRYEKTELKKAHTRRIKVIELNKEQTKKKIIDNFESEKHLATGNTVYHRIYNTEEQNIIDY